MFEKQAGKINAALSIFNIPPNLITNEMTNDHSTNKQGGGGGGGAHLLSEFLDLSLDMIQNMRIGGLFGKDTLGLGGGKHDLCINPSIPVTSKLITALLDVNCANIIAPPPKFLLLCHYLMYVNSCFLFFMPACLGFTCTSIS